MTATTARMTTMTESTHGNVDEHGGNDDEHDDNDGGYYEPDETTMASMTASTAAMIARRA